MSANLVITTLQFDIQWENKTANFNKIESLLKNTQPSHIIVLPEMFSTGFTTNSAALAEKMDGTTISLLKQWSKATNSIIVGSLIVSENNTFYNRMCWVYPNNNIFYYDKRHLFSYANEDKFYTPGTKRLITSVNGWKILSLICYDLRFPIWSRQKQNNDEYDLIIAIASWPASRAPQWEKLLMARAIENQAFVIGVNRIGQDNNNLLYDGNSTIINPMGDILYKKTNAEDIHQHTFEKENLLYFRNHFQFGKDADKFIIIS